MAGQADDSGVGEKSSCFVVEPIDSSNPAGSGKLVKSLDFSFSEWSLSGLIASHNDSSSWSFVSERLLSELFLGPLGSSSSSSFQPSEVVNAFSKAFEATEENCTIALGLCMDELAALRIQLEQLESDPQPAVLPESQREFLLGRSESCKATINRLNDCVTTCILLIRNESDVYVANLGDYYVLLVSASKINGGFNVRQICAPHDLLNPAEHDRLHSLSLPDSEISAFLDQVNAYNELPKFVRCFGGGSCKRPGSPISASPSIFGPEKVDSSSFIAIYNSAFYESMAKQIGESADPSKVSDLVASALFPLGSWSSSERHNELNVVIENLLSTPTQPVSQPNALFVRWFGDQPRAVFGPGTLAFPPLTINVDGDNGFPTDQWAPPPGTIITADQLPKNIAPAVHKLPPSFDREEEHQRSNRPANLQQGEWIPTYVDLLSYSQSNPSTQPEIDFSFAEYARGRLAADELRILGL